MATKPTYTRDDSTTVEMNSLFTSVVDERMDGIIDQIFKKCADLAYLLEREDTDCLGEGGEQFLVPLEVEENTDGGMIDEEEGLPMNDFDPLTMASYTAKTAGYNLRFSRKHQRVIRGSNMMYKLIEVKEKNTIKSMQKTIMTQLWTGSGQGKQANSIQTMIPATATASQSTSVGGISPSTYPGGEPLRPTCPGFRPRPCWKSRCCRCTTRSKMKSGRLR